MQQLTERMKAVLGPFVLRRLKTEVASQLTAKQQHEEVVIMTPEQAALYQKAVEQLRAEVALKSTGDPVGLCIQLPPGAVHQTSPAYCPVHAKHSIRRVRLLVVPLYSKVVHLH